MKTQAEHTPGPWKLEESISVDFDGNKHENIGVITQDHSRIALLGENKQANARLIAAAPLMLQALQEAKLALDAHALRRCKWTRQNQDAYELIQAALAKAGAA